MAEPRRAHRVWRGLLLAGAIGAAAGLLVGPTAAIAGGSNTAGSNTVGVVNALKQGWQATRVPGVQAAVMVCGRLAWSGAAGVGNVTTRSKITPTTRFVLASTTKTVTATMILDLVEQGRLSLTTTLATFYPQLPNASQITVRMLLDHTSGLPDYSNSSTISNLINNDPSHRWARSEIIAALAKMSPAFAPGKQFTYNNSNFVVLGGILEQVSGQSIETDFRQMVAAKVGMVHSSFLYERSPSIVYARPYQQGAGRSLQDQWTPGVGLSTDYWGEVWTDGGLTSTAADLARFGNGLFMGRLLDPATLSEMIDVGPNDYGLGIYNQSIDGRTWIGHDGSYGGYESEEWTDPNRKVTVALTTNGAEPDSAADSNSDLILQRLVKAVDRSTFGAGRCAAPRIP